MTERITITSNEFIEELDLACDNCGEPIDYCTCVICDYCSESTWDGDITDISNISSYGNAQICRHCYDDNFTSCDNCGEPTANDYITFCYECSDEVCSYCAEDRGCDYGHEDYGYEDQPEGVNDYSYKPSPIFHSNQRQDTKIFLGVELETEHQDG